MDDKTLELTEDQIVDEQEVEQPQEKLVVQIGDDEPEEAERAPEWVRDLRKANREKDKRIAELEAKVSGTTVPDPGPKPTLAECDYDEAEFEKRRDAWDEAKRQQQAEQDKQEQFKRTADERWQSRLRFYDEAKAKLGADDFEDAEETVRDVLGKPFSGLQVADIRLNIIKQGAKDPSLVIYALGKNRKAAEELAQIDDPVEYAMAVGRMEALMKTTRKPATQPEGSPPRSAGTGATGSDNTLEKLREEAQKTGDYSKVYAYKRELKRA